MLLTLWTQIPAAVVQLSTFHISRGKHTLMYRMINKKSPVWWNILLCKISKENILESNFLKTQENPSSEVWMDKDMWLTKPGANLQDFCWAPFRVCLVFCTQAQVILTGPIAEYGVKWSACTMLCSCECKHKHQYFLLTSTFNLSQHYGFGIFWNLALSWQIANLQEKKKKKD